jgi:hypothetical protein
VIGRSKFRRAVAQATVGGEEAPVPPADSEESTPAHDSKEPEAEAFIHSWIRVAQAAERRTAGPGNH